MLHARAYLAPMPDLAAAANLSSILAWSQRAAQPGGHDARIRLCLKAVARLGAQAGLGLALDDGAPGLAAGLDAVDRGTRPCIAIRLPFEPIGLDLPRGGPAAAQRASIRRPIRPAPA